MSNRHGSATGHRRSIRLQEYDYAQPGAYFVTICTFNRACLFGTVNEDEVVINDYGRIVEEEWLQTAVIRPYVHLDAYVVMPNHFHGILVIQGYGDEGTAVPCPYNQAEASSFDRRFGRPSTGSLPTIIGAFKSAVTRRIKALHPGLDQPVWQRGYYEHIVRNEEDLDTVRAYIAANPGNWRRDEQYIGGDE